MASIFHNLRTERQYKAATALGKDQFEALFRVFQELYIPKNGNPYLPPAPLSDKREALFFILHYLKAYPGLENMALYFGFSQTGVSHYIDLLLPVVKNALHQCAPVKNTLFKNQKAFDQAFANTEEIIIDVTEIAVERPVDKEKQKKLYTGKKKRIPVNGSS